jgi:3-deoxy-D-manno-octulosonate 8-phosphate phosphatase (KDO 8-P phosphatase)
VLSDSEFIERAKSIELLVLDVDGVLTDGGILIDDQGRELKRFYVRDGFAIRTWQRSGRRAAVISGRTSDAVAHRCNELGIEWVHQGLIDKGPAFVRLIASLDLRPRQVCVLGDDLPDLPIMLASGIGAAVADAVGVVRERADWVSQFPGGQGAIRDLIEQLLSAQGLWTAVIEHYARPAA